MSRKRKHSEINGVFDLISITSDQEQEMKKEWERFAATRHAADIGDLYYSCKEYKSAIRAWKIAMKTKLSWSKPFLQIQNLNKFGGDAELDDLDWKLSRAHSKLNIRYNTNILAVFRGIGGHLQMMACFSPDNLSVFVCDECVIRIDIQTQKILWKSENSRFQFFQNIACSNDGEYVVVDYEPEATEMYTVVLDARTGKQVRNLGLTEGEPREYSCFSADSVHVHTGDNGVECLNFEKKCVQPVRRGAHMPIFYSTCGTYFTSTMYGEENGEENVQKAVLLWDAKNRKVLHTLKIGEKKFMRTCAFSPDGKCLVTRSGQFMHLWNTQTGTLCKTKDQGGILCKNPVHVPPNIPLTDQMSFTPDGTKIVCLPGLHFGRKVAPVAAGSKESKEETYQFNTETFVLVWDLYGSDQCRIVTIDRKEDALGFRWASLSQDCTTAILVTTGEGFETKDLIIIDLISKRW